MATPLPVLSSHERTRVEDYLNDKLQVSADFESLDSLLTSLRAQHDLQRKQLAEAQEALSNASKASDDHAEATRKRAEAFNEQQADIDRRLKALTGSDSSDEAAKRFEASIEKLRRLEISRNYMTLLKEAEQLSKEAVNNIKDQPHVAIKSYTRLRNISRSLIEAQPAAEGAAPHLVDYVEKLASALREQMKAEFTRRLQGTMEEMKWPSKDLNFPEELQAQWTENIKLLLGLQKPELQDRASASAHSSTEPPVLLPLEAMVHPLELRFKYHFSGDKPTNRLDKPEYFLAHIMDLINNFGGFFASYLQPIFDEEAQSVGADLKWNFYNASHAYITALIPVLRYKISTFLPQISTHPQLLSHFVHELMNFDNEVRESWNYLPDPSSNEDWRGMTWDVLTKQGWFDRWLQVEKDFALARYKEIVDTPESGHIDYEGVDLSSTKPTKAAIRVNDLLETITERYQPLSSFSQKLRFLIDIQITIFDHFHERLHSALEAYLAMTSTIGRTVQGADGASIEGVAGLERLSRVFGSAEYLEKKMEDWSNEVFFVELWTELQERVRLNKDGGKNVAGNMSIADVASRTSQAVNNNSSSHGPGTASDGALFDETASAYRQLRLRSESIITSTLTSNARSALKPYSRVSTWASISATTSATPLPPTSDLAPVMRTISGEISFLARVLGVAPLRRIIRQVLLAIQTYIWGNILTRNTFSAAGATQFISDMEHLCSVVDIALGPAGQTSGSMKVMRKLGEGLVLLGLDSADQKVESGGDATQQTEDGSEQDTRAGLWEVEKRLFKDNESARVVLAELGIETLTEAEARSVLERRVEIGN
ncbi:RINT-1 family protein [Aspergillus heteromorphus CBS 117.55]|uniref:RINT-1 family protein n=1 Tax=Aspergillus heteromorphus CBS 117.55 TaxID=1448321 RepID=A0A317X255_9EURO|nr:RINT-1 family protein [Aspergillus heteromorphus CBS 117.55]PWY92435.1 RINT-1 family protein [Aspergillus heteromorphus CBS 117.55]